jgi:uncharacterized Zn-binding protein involved in type VI secretion
MNTKMIRCVNGLVAAALVAATAQATVLTVSYHRLGEADPGAVAGAAVGETTVDSGGSANLTRVGEIAPVYATDTGVAGSTLSVEMVSGGFVQATPVVTLGDNWGLEAWVQADSAEGVSALVYNGNSGNSGMGLYKYGGGFIGLLGGVAFVGNEPINPGVWTHVAIVVASGQTTFYANGVPLATAGAPRVPAGTFNVGIRPDLGEAFQGRIDEVRVFSFEPDQFTTDDLLLSQVPPPTQPPTIVSGPTANPGSPVMAGDNLTLLIAAAGTPPLSYEWRKGGVAIPNGTAPTISFTPVTVADAGEYSVVISSPYGTATSAGLTLTVLPAGSPGVVAAAYYRLGENDPGATAGQSAGLTTQDAEGDRHLNQVGTPPLYSADTGVTGSTLALAVEYGGYTLDTPLLTATDNWGLEAWVKTDYTEENHCIVYNGNSANSGMGIYQLGGNFAGLAGGVAVVGQTPVIPGAWTHLAVVVTGGTTTFYVNGVATGTSGRPNAPTTEGSAFLVGMKPDFSEPFFGLIDEVRVFTVLPGHFSAGDLLLSRVPPDALPPFVVSGPTANPGDRVLAGSTVTLRLVAGGTVPLEYQWRKGGVNLPDATADTLVLSNVTTADSGAYDVSVKNAYGSLTSAVLDLTVLPPGTPTVSTVVYYRLGEADEGAAAGNPSGDTTTDSAGLQNLTLAGWAPTYAAETGVTGSTLCLAVDGGGYRHDSPLFEDPDNWGVEAWVLSETTSENRAIVYHGNSSNSGMGIYQIGDRYQGLIGGVAFVGGTPIVTGEWVHLALVVDNGSTTFYVNGTASGTPAGRPNPPTSADSAFSLGLKNDGVETFSGRVDEVRVFRVSFPGQFSTSDLLLTRVPPSAAPPSLTLSRTAEGVVITWTAGDLQQADAVAGAWTPVAGATSPWTLTPTGAGRFFRAVVP